MTVAPGAVIGRVCGEVTNGEEASTTVPCADGDAGDTTWPYDQSVSSPSRP